jgi:hypothetical protein
VGVTVHFEGRTADARCRDAAIAVARQYAIDNGWPYEEIAEAHAVLKRVIDEQPVDYLGPTVGVQLRPHEAAEPLRLEFDADNFCQDYCKTQFAPVQTHIQVTELLRLLQPQFSVLTIVDEGEYFETRDLEKLQSHLDNCFKAMERLVAEKPSRSGPVRLPSGRIIDLQG